MVEFAVQIEKDVELSSLQKFDRFLKLVGFFHVERCENVDCSYCMLIINLRYLYIEKTVIKSDSIDSLQKCCREKYINFYSLRYFLRTLGEIEKKRIQLDKEFTRTLEIWNTPVTQYGNQNMQI